MKSLALSFAAVMALAGAPLVHAQPQSSYASGSSPNGVLMRSDGIYLRCDQCGVVQSIEHGVTEGRQHGTAGAILGAVAGGVLGNQVGKGKGRKLATVGGAVGGGFAGHAIGNGGGGDTYTVRLKMSNGTYSNVQVQDASGIREGDVVQVDANGNITRVQ